MSFLAPLFLAGAAAMAVPILLHFLEQHVDHRVKFAAVRLLKTAPAEYSSRRWLREWLLLVLRVGALVLLSLAFARPFFRSATAIGGQLTVVALDTSLSMSGPLQASEARRRATDAIRTAPAGDVAVVTFSDRAEVVVQPTSSRGVALSAVDATTAGYGTTNYRAGLVTAGALFRGKRGKIVFVSDLQANGWDGEEKATVPEGVDVELQNVGSLTDNLAVTDVRADGDGIVATVANSGPTTRDARVRLAIDGERMDDVAIQIGGHDVGEARFGSIRGGGVAEVSVDDPNGIQGDNSRFAFVHDPAVRSVLVVTTSGDLDRDAWYVRNALLAAAGGSQSRSVTGVSTAQLGAWTEDRLSQFSAIAVLSSRGLERRARERLAAYISGGGGLLLAAGPDVDGTVISDLLGTEGPLEMTPAESQTSMAPVDIRHPVFRAFSGNAGSLTFVRFRSIAHVAAPNCQSIARFSSGDAAIVDCSRGFGRALVIGSDLDNRWNDFPTRTSFVPFIDQAIRYLSNGRQKANEYLVGDVPPGVAPVPGLTDATIAGRSRRVIVNVDPREAQLDRMSPGDFLKSIARFKQETALDARLGLAEQESRQHVWQYVIAAMLLVLCIEGVVAARVS